MTEARLDSSKGRLKLMIPLLLTAAVYLFSASGRAVTDYDEGYYSQAALQMVERGDWVTPYVNGVRFLEKPPLMYWLTAASYRIFGVNEFALRLPTALAVIGLVWLVMLIARRTSGERAAVIAGLSTAFSTGTYLFTREALHDIWLVLFITLAMYAFLEWYMDPQHSRRHAMLFYAALAGAVMCKSLVGAFLPAGIVVVFHMLRRERIRWRAMHVLPGLLLFFSLTIPWHLLAAIRNEGFLRYFFVNEQFLRFFGRHDPPVVWSLPLLTFWALIPVWFFPWTAFLPAAFSVNRRLITGHERILVKLALAWAVVILVFFSLTGRLEHYAFPAIPALSLLVGLTLVREGNGRSITWAFRGLAILGIIVLLAGIVMGVWLIPASGGLENSGSEPARRIYETDFSILTDMPVSIQRDLIKPAAITIVVLALGFPAALCFDSRRRRMTAIISLVLVMVVICSMIHWSFSICEDMISSKKFALAVANEARAEDRLVVVGDYESANSMSFYQPLHVELLEGEAYALIPGMKYPDAPNITLTEEEFQAAWNSSNRIFALVPNAWLDGAGLQGVEVLQILDRVLIRNH